MKTMKIVIDNKRGPQYIIKKIVFCCSEMAESILLHRIKAKHWTDHCPRFFIGDFALNNCPHCGAEIEERM